MLLIRLPDVIPAFRRPRSFLCFFRSYLSTSMSPLSLDYTQSTYFVHTIKSTDNPPISITVPAKDSTSLLTKIGPIGEGSLANEIVYELKGQSSANGLSESAVEIRKYLQGQGRKDEVIGAGKWEVMQPKMRVKRGGGEF